MRGVITSVNGSQAASTQRHFRCRPTLSTCSSSPSTMAVNSGIIRCCTSLQKGGTYIQSSRHCCGSLSFTSESGQRATKAACPCTAGGTASRASAGSHPGTFPLHQGRGQEGNGNGGQFSRQGKDQDPETARAGGSSRRCFSLILDRLQPVIGSHSTPLGPGPHLWISRRSVVSRSGSWSSRQHRGQEQMKP